MSLRGTAWEPGGIERVPRAALPPHRWGLYALVNGADTLLATAAEREALERLRAALGRGEIRRTPGVRGDRRST